MKDICNKNALDEIKMRLDSAGKEINELKLFKMRKKRKLCKILKKQHH